MSHEEHNSSIKPVRMSRWGYGPYYVGTIAVCTVAGTGLNVYGLLESGAMNTSWIKLTFILVGVLAAVAGVVLWVAAVLGARIMRRIDNGQLVTSGVYGWVRHPIYSAFMIFFTGVLVAQANLWLLLLPPVFWGLLTVLMKNTEERWLLNAFGQEYADYARQVNRCIPRPPRCER